MDTKLKTARKIAGKTQTQLARECSISLLTYQNYESGQRIPRADVAIRIAEALGTTVEDLFREVT